MLNTPFLRRTTLALDRAAIVEALRNGKNPARFTQYRHYPNAYAFRVYDRRLPQTRRLIAAANQELFAAFQPSAADAARSAEPEITEGYVCCRVATTVPTMRAGCSPSMRTPANCRIGCRS